jgi:hypothetical protein
MVHDSLVAFTSYSVLVPTAVTVLCACLGIGVVVYIIVRLERGGEV